MIPDDGVEDSIAATALKQHRDRPWLLRRGRRCSRSARILALSEARFWPSPGNLWLAAALAGAAIVWWQVSTHRAGRALRAPPATTRPRAGRAARAHAARCSRSRPVLLIGGLGVVGLLDATGAVHVDWRIVLAVAAIGTRRARRGRRRSPARRSAASSCSALGVLAALALAFAVRVPLFAGVGDQVEHPATVAAVHSTYEHGIGDFHVDLQDVALPGRPART